MKSIFTLLLLLTIMSSGCTNNYYTDADFVLVKKIDSHIHINSDDGVFEGQAESDNFVLITLNVDHSDSAVIRSQYNYAVRSAEEYPGRVFFGPTFFFDTAGWHTEKWSEKIISQLEKDIDGGGMTVKIWKNIGMTVRDKDGKFIMVDDPGLDKVIEFIKSKGLPITGHLGEPRNCWLPVNQMTVSSDANYFESNPKYHMYLHPEYPSYEDQIAARDNFIAKHPDMLFIGCHLGSLEWNIDSLASRLNRFPNMAVDMSARICHLQFQTVKERDRVRDFCIKYQDRLLYGTDVTYSGNESEAFRKEMHNTWIDDWKYFTSKDEMTSNLFNGNFKGLQLPKEVVDKIYRKNAVSWYKLSLN